MAVDDPVRVPLLWRRHHVTLDSALTPLEVRERLAEILPRFGVPSGVAIPRFGLSWSQYYLGSLSEEQFTLIGPCGRGKSIPSLSVQGTVTSDGEGTLIHLTVCPTGVLFGFLLICLSGVILSGLVAVLEHVIVFPLVLLVVFSLLSGVFYAIARSSAVHQLNELLECLEDLWNARRRT